MTEYETKLKEQMAMNNGILEQFYFNNKNVFFCSVNNVMDSTYAYP